MDHYSHVCSALNLAGPPASILDRYYYRHVTLWEISSKFVSDLILWCQLNGFLSKPDMRDIYMQLPWHNSKKIIVRID
jgi:hypothetical protein